MSVLHKETRSVICVLILLLIQVLHTDFMLQHFRLNIR